MSIANELSSDVAAAVLARSSHSNSVDGTKPQTDARELVDLLLDFHSVLRALTVEARRRRFLRVPLSNAEQSLPSKQAAAGN